MLPERVQVWILTDPEQLTCQYGAVQRRVVHDVGHTEQGVFDPVEHPGGV